MRKILLLFLCGLLVLYTSPVLAQDKIVTGTVTGENNRALRDVTVTVKGTRAATKTSDNGTYSIRVNAGQVLVFTFVDYASQEVSVGSENTINVRMVQTQKDLGEVVVTGYGITRQKKSLGYSTQVVDGGEIAQTRRENFFNSLAGRVAGATVTASSGAPGASSQIILRGATSIGGNNQPLIVVDGVPYDNQTLNQEALIGGQSIAFTNRNADYGNRAMDINPSDIENVTILKGSEATSIYGSDGASGAIVITTKKGKAGKTSIYYDNSFRYEKLYRFHEIQTEYGIGRNGVSDASAVTNPYSILGTAAGAGVPSAFGAKIPDSVQTFDNKNAFFEGAFTQQHNLTIEGGNEISTLRLSTNYTSQSGIVPNTGYDKVTFRLSGSTKLLNRVSANSSFSYTNSTTDKATKGAGGYLLNLLTWPVVNDVADYINPNGTRKNLRSLPGGDLTLEYDNPFWDVNKNPSQDKLDRFTGNITLASDINEWLNLSGIFGIDYYTQYGYLATHPLSRFGYASNGFYSLYSQSTRNVNGVIKAAFKKNFTDVTNTLTTGFAFENNNSKLEAQKGERFYEREFLSINNTDPLSRDAKTTLTNIRKLRFFGNLVTGYKNLLFLSLSGTQEGVSTFMSRVVEKDPFFLYGSGSLSFVVSDLKGVKNSLPFLNFAKARLSYATTGKGPYAAYVIDYRFANQITTGGGYAYDVTGNNFDLKPEFSKNLEYGVELKMFNNRVGLDLAIYNLQSENQLLAARASYGTGYVIKWFNGGLVENNGVEIQLNLKPIVSKNFNWQSTINFDRNVGVVKEMPAGLPTYYDSDTWVFGNLRSQYFEGARIGNMASNKARRNNAGQVLISPTTGLAVKDDEFTTVGNREPDFKIGWVNNFDYKNFTFSFLIDFRNGGSVFNGTEYLLYLTGYSKKTLNRETPLVLEGVLQDGLENSATPTVNNIAITPNYNSDFYNTTNATEVDFVEDVSWMRLRDLTLAYHFPQNMLGRQKVIKSASVFVTGTDLLMITNYSGADPSVNANTAANRGFGGAGIDYGSVSTPRGVNFGLKISL